MRLTNMATITTATATPPAAKAEQVPRCPRCDSPNTKFCYYNNHSLSQPRHFCKACRPYWTRGGTLRNVPGGGCRKGVKRVKRRNFTNHASSPSPYNTRIEPVNPHRRRQPSVANPNLPVRHQYPAAISSPSPSQDISSLFFGITDDNINPTTSFSNADDVYSRFGSDIDQLMQPKIELVCHNQPLLPSGANLAAEDHEKNNLMGTLITGSMDQWQANYPFELALNYNAASASIADGASDSPYTYWSNISAMGSAFPFKVQP